jgi:predicted oxidoreductase
MSAHLVALCPEGPCLSSIVQGMWRLMEWNYTRVQLAELIAACLEVGVTTFDHADIYGAYQCEARFGEVWKDVVSRREDIQLVSKCDIRLVCDRRPEHYVQHYDTSRTHIIQSVETSLRQLDTEYLDLLLLHRPDPLLAPAEVAQAFAELRSAGKVRHFGVSNFLPHQFLLLQSALDVPLVTNQIEYSVIEMKHQEDGTIDMCLMRGLRPMAWSPLAGGHLFQNASERAARLRPVMETIGRELGDATLDQVALAWILRHPAQFLPVLGTGQPARIRAAVAALDMRLSRQQWFAIWQASTGHRVP